MKLSQNSKTICFFIERFFPNPTGATISAMRLAKELRRREYSVFWVTSHDSKTKSINKYDDFKVFQFPFSGSGKVKKFKAVLRMLLFLIRNRHKFDIFHVHGAHYLLLFIAWFVRRIIGKPTLMKITLDGWDTPDGILQNKYPKLGLSFYNSLSAVVSMTSGQKVKCEQANIKGFLQVIPNGYESEIYQPFDQPRKLHVKHKLNLSPTQKHLIYVGWLGQRKGSDILFKAWKNIAREYPNVNLLCVGNYHGGFEGFKNFIEQENINFTPEELKRIIVTDFVDNVQDYLKCADIFVFPSRQEGFGTVQVEAMACGLACVVLNLPGVTNDIYTNNQNGIILQNKNPSEMENAILELLRNDKKRELLANQAVETALKNFEIRSVADKYCALYNQLSSQQEIY